MIPKSMISVIHLFIYTFAIDSFLFSFHFHSHAINMSLVIWAWEGKSGKIKRIEYSLIIWFCFSTAFMHAWKMEKYKISVENSFQCDEIDEETHPYRSALTICWTTLQKKQCWNHGKCSILGAYYPLLLSESFNSLLFFSSFSSLNFKRESISNSTTIILLLGVER